MNDPVFAMPPDDELPVIAGHQVTAEELKAVSSLATPFFVGLGPLAENMTPRQIRQESRRRARRILPNVTQQLQPSQTADGKPVVGFLFSTFFLLYILPSLVSWVVDKILEWAIAKEWDIVFTSVAPKACNIQPAEIDTESPENGEH